MNIFTKFSVAALVLGTAISANAQGLGTAAYVDPQPNSRQTFLRAATLGWSSSILNGLDLIEIADTDLSILVSFGGQTYTLEYADYDFDVYLDPDFQTNGEATSALQGNVLTVSWGTYAFEAGEPVGEYVITIPEGLVKNANGQTNAEQVIKYYKVDPINPVSVTPQSGGLYPDLNTVTVTFPETVTRNTNGSYPTLTNTRYDSEPYVLNREASIGADGKSIVLNVTDLMTKGEWYYIEIPEGFVNVGENGVNARVYLEYMNWNGMSQAEIISKPTRVTNLESLNPYLLKYDRPIKMPSTAPDVELIYGYPDAGWQVGGRIFIPAEWFELVYVDEEGEMSDPTTANPANSIYLSADDLRSLLEDYVNWDIRINFPSGLVVSVDGDLKNPPLETAFSIMSEMTQTTITGDAGVISIKWDRCGWITYALGDEEVTLTDDQTNESRILDYDWGGWGGATGEVHIDNETATLTVDLNGLNLKNGNYILMIPQQYVWLYEVAGGEPEMNARIEYKFYWDDGKFGEFTQVELVTEDGDSAVYDLQGRKVGTSLEGLSRGIYIVNGKKVLKF